MRIVTRPDFDGIVCAVLIHEAEEINSPILWVEPGEIQKGKTDIKEGDIMANLPYDSRCSIWFDHHVSNNMAVDFKGAFKIAPSAAGIVYEYYLKKGKITQRFDELIYETDIIDAADLTEDQVLHPENYPYILLSMTVKNREAGDPPYWNRLVALLREHAIGDVLKDKEVKARCEKVIQDNLDYEEVLRAHTVVDGAISIFDLRSFENVPSGNRFLSYSLFPQTIACIKIRYDYKDKDTVLISIGRSIFNEGSRVNIGKLLARYGGGGHAGAGGCSMDKNAADANIKEIIEIMKANKPLNSRA